MYFLLIHLAVYCNSDFHSLAASKVYSLFLAFISLSIMCLYRCVCSAFIPSVSAEYLRFVACSLDPYLFKYFLCCILFLFYSWNFIFWHIRYYPRTFGYLILFFHPYVSVCILSTDLFSCSMIFFILCWIYWWAHQRQNSLLLPLFSIWLFLSASISLLHMFMHVVNLFLYRL